MKGLFVTGTDTDVGKTVVSAILAQAFSELLPTSYFKPIQAGSLANTDTDEVMRLTSAEVDCQTSTYLLKSPMSPNRAAEIDKIEINLDCIINDLSQLTDRFVIVEGAGGALVPVNNKQTIVDMAVDIDWPVVVVASTRLGTINHTLLTWQTLKIRGLQPIALVLVGERDEGLSETLRQFIDIPHLIEIAKLETVTPANILNEVNHNQVLRAFAKSIYESLRLKNNIEEDDKKYIWHPFTQHKLVDSHPQVVSGRGAYLKLKNGQKLFDGISSWWTNLHGHGHPKMAQAISGQAHQLEHVIFAGYTHAPAVNLVKKLINLTQERGCRFQRGFFSDNGSTAVEVALKMAFQYHRNGGDDKRTRFLALKNSYHGDTLGAMSVGAREGFHQVFEPLMFAVDYVDPNNTTELHQLMQNYGDQYAAVIVEPVVQGAGGMKMYSPDFLNQLGKVCREKGVLTIADEIFTGFYRTGRLFAFEHSQWKPDLLCLSKGLTGGYLPLSLTLTSEDLFSSFVDSSVKKAFLHGHSYTANPIACRAGLASLEILQSSESMANLEMIVAEVGEQIQKLSTKHWCQSPRHLGTIGAFEVAQVGDYFSNANWAQEFAKKAMESGYLLRPLGSTVYVVPPYCSTKEEVNKIYQFIEKTLDSWSRQ